MSSTDIETLPVSEFFTRGVWPPTPSPSASRAVLRAFSPGGLGILFISNVGTLPASPSACFSCARAAVLRAALSWCELDVPARTRLFSSEKLGSDAPRAGTLALRWDGADAAGAWPAAHALAAAAENPCASAPYCSMCGERAASSTCGDAIGSSGDERAAGGASLNSLVGALGCALSTVCAGVAAAADDALQLPARSLFRALVGAGTAKARAVSYPVGASPAAWQPWHYDYGIFSALVSPAVATDRGARILDSGAFARAFPNAGLIVRLCSGADAVAYIPAGCIGVQVGESAQILTGGRLVATPHCVRAPAGTAANEADGEVAIAADEISRASFVVFCQPPWDARLTAVEDGALARERVLEASQRAAEGLGGQVPLLADRWADGDSYSIFSRATTSAYFGSRGTQRGKTI